MIVTSDGECLETMTDSNLIVEYCIASLQYGAKIIAQINLPALNEVLFAARYNDEDLARCGEINERTVAIFRIKPKKLAA